jgi:hypothetical protein
MKKITLIAIVLFLTKAVSAQMVVDAVMFKNDPSQFAGKTITIQNVTFKSNSSNPGGAPAGGPSAPGAPAGGVAPGAGKGQSVFCNQASGYTVTKWNLGPNNDVCLQVDSKTMPMINQLPVGSTVTSITFRCTPDMYVVTKVTK